MENNNTNTLVQNVCNSANNSINKIYSLFNTKQKIDLLDGKIKKTPYRGQDSNNSLQFEKEGFDHLFNDGTEGFKTKLQSAVSGLEKVNSRILTLHSSSLISFLTFYNVSNENPLEIENIKDNNSPIVFTNSAFEVGNVIKESGHQSKIDIALFDGKNIKSSNHILLLESKFKEYITDCGQDSNISACYSKEISNIIKEIKDLNLTIAEDEKNEGHFILKQDKPTTSLYCKGIKQMICHFLGAKEFAKMNNNKQIYLGTILYKFDKRIIKEDKFVSYRDAYKKLAEILNKHLPQNSNLHILEEPLFYNDVLKSDHNNIPQNVKVLYL